MLIKPNINLTLVNGNRVRYGAIKIGICFECNQKFCKIEKSIKKWAEKDDSYKQVDNIKCELVIWLCKIIYGSVLYRRTNQKNNLKDKSFEQSKTGELIINIVKNYLRNKKVSSIIKTRNMHCVSPPGIFDSNDFSLFLFHTQKEHDPFDCLNFCIDGLSPGESIFLKINNVGIILVFDNGCRFDRNYLNCGDIFQHFFDRAKIDLAPLNTIQSRELFLWSVSTSYCEFEELQRIYIEELFKEKTISKMKEEYLPKNLVSKNIFLTSLNEKSVNGKTFFDFEHKINYDFFSKINPICTNGDR